MAKMHYSNLMKLTIKNIVLSKSLVTVAIILSFFAPTKASACDICGCFMGITPYDNQSSFALQYRYRSFNGYYGQPQSFFPSGSRFLLARNNHTGMITDHNGNPNDYEIFKALEFRTRLFISRRIEVNAILPYNSNSEYYNGNLSTLAGIGDVNVYAGYHLLNTVEQILKQRLIVGAGIKLPIGKNDFTNNVGERYGTLTQTGTGSTDGFVYFNYLAGYKNAGLSISGTYKANGQNKNHEGIANSTTGYLNLFYNVSLSKDIKMIPSAQLAYEYSGGEKFMGVKTGEHVMNNLMSGFGVDLFIKNISLNLAVQTKAWSATDDHPQPSGRVVLGVTYSFKQLYYLVN